MTLDQDVRPFHHPVAWVPLLKQPHLPHQLDLMFVRKRTHVRGVCNCGWVSTPVPTTDQSNLPRVEYAAHLLREGVITESTAVYEEQMAWSWPV